MVNMFGILIAAAVVGGTGLFIAIFLGLSGRKFQVEVDPREEEILSVLPGNNCGGCGFPGCSGLAAAICAKEAAVDACPVGGEPVSKAIGSIMGVEASHKEREVAFVKCAGTTSKTVREYEYRGIMDCTIAAQMQDAGPKGCFYGCLGFGTCVRACPFDAIRVEDGVAVVQKDACRACKKCVSACPKHLIEMIPYKKKTFVQCCSNEKGKALMGVCSVGCIGCRMCEKNCPTGAVTVKNFLAHIDSDTCTNCGKCAEVCPRHIITCRDV